MYPTIPPTLLSPVIFPEKEDFSIVPSFVATIPPVVKPPDTDPDTAQFLIVPLFLAVIELPEPLVISTSSSSRY